MSLKFEQVDEGIYNIHASEEGPHVMVMAGIHGNEISGGNTIEHMRKFFIRQSHTLLRGTITLVAGNPKAIEQNTRFVDYDANRMFRPDSEMSGEMLNAYEYTRVKLLMSFIEEHSPMLLLDLHGMTTHCPPFILTIGKDDEHNELIKQMPFDYWIHGWEGHIDGTAAKYVNDRGGYSIVAECGEIDNLYSMGNPFRTTTIFLNYFGLTNFPVGPKERCEKQLRIVHNERIAHHDSFRYIDPGIKSFDRIPPGTLIAIDEVKEYRAPQELNGREVDENFVLVFRASDVSIRAKQQDAYYLALESEL